VQHPISKTIEELEIPDGADQLKANLTSNGAAGVVQEHLILGVDERGLQIEKSRWLTENPRIKVIETIIQQEPPSLLVRIGGK
jgi:hypothetical protein